MNTVQTLQAAKALITDSKRWIKGEMALDEDGECVRPERFEALCFCIVGAVSGATKDSGNRQCALAALTFVLHPQYDGFITNFNDSPNTTRRCDGTVR